MRMCVVGIRVHKNQHMSFQLNFEPNCHSNITTYLYHCVCMCAWCKISNLVGVARAEIINFHHSEQIKSTLFYMFTLNRFFPAFLSLHSNYDMERGPPAEHFLIRNIYSDNERVSVFWAYWSVVVGWVCDFTRLYIGVIWSPAPPLIKKKVWKPRLQSTPLCVCMCAARE